MKGKKNNMETLAMAMKLAEEYHKKYGGPAGMTAFPAGGGRPTDEQMFMENQQYGGNDPLYGIPTQDRMPGAEFGHGSSQAALGEDPRQEEERRRKYAEMQNADLFRKNFRGR